MLFVTHPERRLYWRMIFTLNLLPTADNAVKVPSAVEFLWKFKNKYNNFNVNLNN